MKLRPIRNRSQLMALAKTAAPSRACVRAIEEGNASVLGGFTPPEGLPFWLVRVISQHGKEWLIAICVDEASRTFKRRNLTEIPWAHWDGDPKRGHPIYDGDQPEHYAWQKKNAESHQQASSGSSKPSTG